MSDQEDHPDSLCSPDESRHIPSAMHYGVLMNDELLQRVRRIHAALRSAQESNPKKLQATVTETEKIKAVVQDFRNGLSDEELANRAYTLIYNIAHLGVYLEEWAKRNGKDKKEVDECVRQSFELQIILDLSNRDKHLHRPRDGGRSRRSPKLVQVNRVLRMTTKAKPRSVVGMTLGADGTPVFFGDGDARAIVTGDVVDGEGNRIGDLYNLASKAIGAWEQLLRRFGVDLGTDGTADTNR